MPYGIPKSLGGDSAKNDAQVEKVVNALMRQGKSKGAAIAIAKAQLHHHAGVKQMPKRMPKGMR